MRAEWASKIRELRRRLNLSQVQVARRLAVTKKTIAEWEQSRQPPSPERCLQLARLAEPGPLRTWFVRHALERLGADPALVLDALLPQAAPAPIQAPLPATELGVVAPEDLLERFRAARELDSYAPIPLLKDAAAAGTPRTISEADIEGYVLVPFLWCPRPGNFTCVRARGDSMAPILSDGALVAINHTRRDPQALHQKMVAVYHQEGVTIKWLERLRAGTLRLVPENKNHPTLTLSRIPENPIIGVVAWWWTRQP